MMGVMGMMGAAGAAGETRTRGRPPVSSEVSRVHARPAETVPHAITESRRCGAPG
ncbi:hypothetical protein PNO31109_00254 [Pandoraea nosoerga]|uniref:Uncharacterized protein n=1 Tax=Pandoraea nosoerga TaxID=2508296 RepID=A0A5E4RM22_9BURK|nr:hypothetical protein PNO31109_00254 [Pandoraea nosoerga]